MIFSSLSRHAPKIAAGSTALGTATYLYYNPKTGRTERVVIVGGGTAGVGVASMLRRDGLQNVTIIEPSDTHYYQPLWTLVGGGAKAAAESGRPMAEMIPSGTSWVKGAVKSFQPTKNTVTTDDGTEHEYDYLVVATGLKIDWEAIPGLTDGLKKEDSGVVSIYDYNYSQKTYDVFNRIVKDQKKDASNGDSKKKFLFTMAPMPIKCAGAPQKIMWILEDKMRSLGVRGTADITFFNPGGAMFGVKHYSDKLEQIRQDRDVAVKFGHQLVSVDSDNKVATFKNVKTGQLVKEEFDMFHATPPMVAPDVIKSSPLADGKGWIDVDKNTLQSTKFPNVFGLGDCTNTPNSKTAAAITAQAPVLVHNLQKQMQGKELDASYNGYASCPLIISQNKVMLAEFGYGGKLMETFAKDGGKYPIGTDGALQQRFFYVLKERLFPYVYWNLWPKGLWYGTYGPMRPNVGGKDSMEAGK